MMENEIKVTKEVMIDTKSMLFDYINPNGNDFVSKMNYVDLADLIYYINHYYLEFRNQLGFHRSITFGLELEFEYAFRKRIERELQEKSLSRVWRLCNEDSLDDGAEINSNILRDNSHFWLQLKQVCHIVSKHAVIGPHSGGHIHVGTQVIGGKIESWLNFIKLWSIYENIIYRFSYGSFLTARSSIEYAEPMSKILFKVYQEWKEKNLWNIDELITKISHFFTGINVNNVVDFYHLARKNTIEFRCPNGTLDPVIWQNNLNLFVHMLLYSKSTQYDDDIIEKRRIINQDKNLSLQDYEKIDLPQALELCDMLFDCNLDKIYFLRQYLKSFEISHEPLSRAKTFTKK